MYPYTKTNADLGNLCHGIHDHKPQILICSVHNLAIMRFHGDVIKWKHFPRYWPFVWGIHRWPVSSPHKGQWRGACVFSLICLTGSRPDSKTWRLFYFGDLWPEGLLASLTYINGPSGDRQIWKVLQWKSDKYFKMNIRTTQLNGPIQCKILFYTSVPDFVIISTTFMWYLRKNRAALGKHCIPCQDGVQKSDFVT